MTPFAAASLLVTCEHASNRVPAAYAGLGLTAAQLASHIAWDPGAGSVARALARRFGCPCHPGRWTRLLVDLNRSERHPKLVARRSFGVVVPGNAGIAPEEIERRTRRFHRPYRRAVLEDVRRIRRRCGACLHLSVHSFAPVVDGRVRRTEIGLLYDPQRTRERRFARTLAPLLRRGGLHVRLNHPYRGTSDGHTSALRRLHAGAAYAGIEIEMNQKLLRTPAAARSLAATLGEAIAALLA